MNGLHTNLYYIKVLSPVKVLEKADQKVTGEQAGNVLNELKQ